MKRRSWLLLSVVILLCVFGIIYIARPKIGHAPSDLGSAPEKGLYVHTNPAFAVRYQDGFTVDEHYVYSSMGPGKEIHGVSFMIPKQMSEGTNLSSDTRMSVEWKEKTTCSVGDFLEGAQNVQTSVDGDTTYVIGMSGGAGAGNRYEEAVYVPEGTGCTAIRYFIHSTVLENYEPGTRKAFDRTALMSAFDGMRRSFSHEGALD